MIEKILHMLRVKDCRHVCLFCEYFNTCKKEYEAEAAEGSEDNELKKCNEERGHGTN